MWLKHFFLSKLRLQTIQLRGNQKDVNFQLHHRLSKFEVPVVVNLKHTFELFGLYNTCLLIQKLSDLIRSSSDGQFWKKSQKKKGGKFELRSQLCYYHCNYNHFTLCTFCLVKNLIRLFYIVILRNRSYLYLVSIFCAQATSLVLVLY